MVSMPTDSMLQVKDLLLPTHRTEAYTLERLVWPLLVTYTDGYHQGRIKQETNANVYLFQNNREGRVSLLLRPHKPSSLVTILMELLPVTLRPPSKTWPIIW